MDGITNGGRERGSRCLGRGGSSAVVRWGWLLVGCFGQLRSQLV